MEGARAKSAAMASTSAYGPRGSQAAVDSRPGATSEAVLLSIAQEVVASAMTAQAAVREAAGETFTH